MENLNHQIEWIAKWMELSGVTILVLGLLYALFQFVRSWKSDKAYTQLRQQIGKAILLGLEVMVAADIIMTVATEPTLDNVLVLAVIVLIRTFLSISLEVELEGKWPWQGHAHPDIQGADDPDEKGAKGIVDRS